ncbi:receptor-like cytosolic serine/threonine-protein kinase RBK1 isoform X2 [Pistacia vera]|uniref:receptor-like cytosolic serine/threonine-protein kinase RBK1 isoform X2 n=1 Tax=Pistacia vera TaxID=55513 RepID=UPI00126329D6|nr:receptor-like cytosolic serine/threonine-protein kinase RBK1 isoform X2 [Pistacia vera]
MKPEPEMQEREAASPRGVLEIPVAGTDSDNSSSCCNSTEKLTPERSTPVVNREGGYASHWKSMIDAIKKKRLFVIPLLTNYDLTGKNLWKKLARIQNLSTEDSPDVEGLSVSKPSWRKFEYEELAAATDNFCPGKGGHAEVYKGCLSDGRFVAVKKLIREEKEEEDRVSDFLSELGIIAHIKHENAARLIGFSTENGLHLVLQYLPKGSLASLLFGCSAQCIEWKIRYKIALGVADGLKYLHHDCHRRIIHRDIKASNILLTDDFDAQISDFGLAKWLPENWPHHVVFPIEGTFGYLAPEYFMHGVVDEKTDVFAFGVLLLELITGRRAVDSCRQSLVIWAKPLLDTNNVKELVDPRLREEYDPTEMKRAMLAASMCIHHMSINRPHMNRVALMLRGEDKPQPQELKPKPSARRTVVFDGCDLQDYTCASYVNEINRHMQLVME